MQVARPTVTRFERTCWGMPAQWEGEFSDGREWYGRYRGGRGYICAAPKDESNEYSVLDGPTLVSYFNDANQWDGLMSDRQFVALLSLVADVPSGVVPPYVPPKGEEMDEWDTERIADVPLSVTVHL